MKIFTSAHAMKYHVQVWILLTLFSHMRRRSHVSYDAVCVMQLVSFGNFSTFLWVSILKISYPFLLIFRCFSA